MNKNIDFNTNLLYNKDNKTTERGDKLRRNLLIKYRGERSQEEMGLLYGVTQQAWSRWEQGITSPRHDIMLRIEKDSGMKMEDIFFDIFQQQN